MIRLLAALLLFPACLAVVPAFPQFDNALSEAPTVSCNRGSIALNIAATHGAPSYVFAKGHYNKDGCSYRNETHVTFDFDKCNIRRKREVNPRGMAYSMTVVVQLHPLFITKVDRAYAVRCFYMEAEKNVGAALGVSELTTAILSQEHPQPTCSYALHKDSANGPLLRYAHVGDAVYHVWSCPSDVYAMLIHTCFVQDGQGQEQQVIDDQGCSTDHFLMPELIYAEDRTKTFTASNAFNFPDVTSVQFSCQIKLCFKGSDGCEQLTPPKCNGTLNIDRAGNRTWEEMVEVDEDLVEDGLISTTSSTLSDTVFGDIIDNGESTTESLASSSLSSSTITTIVYESTTVTVRSNDTAEEIRKEPFPTPKSLRQFIKDKYGETEEGSGLEEEIVQREERRRDIKRRDTDTLDLDISSPELTILDKELAASAPLVDSPSAALSSSTPLSESVCVPLTAFWLLVGLVLLSLSFILVAICKASTKQGFVQF